MRIVVFGATGGTGRELVKQGLALNHEVTAFVRQPDKMRNSFVNHKALDLAVGDAKDAKAVAAAVAGRDAVLSALGSRSLADDTLLPESMTNILAAMKQSGVRRLVVLGASGVFPGAGARLSPAMNLLLRVVSATLLKKPFESQRRMQELIHPSETEWTVVQPPRLLNEPGRQTWRVDANALPAGGTRIARADVAAFMLAQLESWEWVRKSPFVAW